MTTPYTYNLPLRFREVARLHAERPALRFGVGDDVSYEALNAYANRAARLFLDLGVRSGDVVAIGGDKHLDSFVALLAALKVGAAYCFLDPDNPPERLRRILSRCRPRILVVADPLGRKLDGVRDPSECVVVDGGPGALLRQSAGLRDAELPESEAIEGGAPAYIMFTSGSTGFPKGAVISHASVLHLVDWAPEYYGLTPSDVLTNLFPLHFDGFVTDLYLAWFSGACVGVFARDVLAQGDLLLRRVDDFGCTSWCSVPSLLMYLDNMRLLHDGCFRTLRRIVLAGEGYPKARLKKLFDLFGARVFLHNAYGPTECTCLVADHRISERDFQDLAGFPPLGRPGPNVTCLILDEDGRPTAEGQVGELCLLGPQVALGYCEDPERTAAAFVPNPVTPACHERMYRTGDLVWRDSEGLLHFMGRRDNQIKHMGYRIELEEIETSMAGLPYVRRAAALFGTRKGVSHIVAVLSCSGDVVAADVRRDLRPVLPSYMIPTIIEFLPEIPSNHNGKVDRRRLAQLFLDATSGA